MNESTKACIGIGDEDGQLHVYELPEEVVQRIDELARQLTEEHGVSKKCCQCKSKQAPIKTEYEEEQVSVFNNYSEAVYPPLYDSGNAIIHSDTPYDITARFVALRSTNADLHDVLVRDFANLANNAVDLYSRHLATLLELNAYHSLGTEISSRKQMYKLISDHSE